MNNNAQEKVAQIEALLLVMLTADASLISPSSHKSLLALAHDLASAAYIQLSNPAD